MSFITEDFLLHSDAARRLYWEYAAHEPILDFHNHFSPQEIADDINFANLTEIWFGTDHYKWRAMRTEGIEERLITGNADPYDKFLAWARTVPKTLRNPLYHWTHLELRRYFAIDLLLNEDTAPEIWKEANRLLETPEFTTRSLMRKFKVAALCTTDDPADDLEHHRKLLADGILVYPTFRPDQALRVDAPEDFRRWAKRLSATAKLEISSLQGLLDALSIRHQAFHELGARLSDHGLNSVPDAYATETEAAKIFDKTWNGDVPTVQEQESFAGFLMLFLARLDAEKGWTKQLHLGALRDANSSRVRTVGQNTGFDSIGDYRQVQPLAKFFDKLDSDNLLPKTILYNNNPVDNYSFSSLVGAFQREGIPGKIQFGAGWWFLDAKPGIEWQLDALSNNGSLSRFVGMLTDSRSFMSFPRHEYFRRILCNKLGSEMELGELPRDFSLVGGMVRNICFENARQYLGLPNVISSAS